MTERVALLAATSGHSGVDRVMRNLAVQFDAWGLGVDLLRVRGHGPDYERDPLTHARRIDLGSAHVYGALPGLVRYLRRARPVVMLSDKDRVNRIALAARALAGTATRVAVRIGTAVSANLAARGFVERALQRGSMRWLYPRAAVVLVPAAAVATDLIAYARLDPARVRVVPSPIVAPRLFELAAAPVPHPWLAPGEPPVIVGVGELSARKDFATLLRAFARVRAQRPCRLLLLGRGRRAGELRALAAALNVADAVALPGFVANPYAFLARAALFALCSRWEGLSVALVEALALHVPAVVTDAPGGSAELLAGQQCGALVPVGDERALAAALAVWLDHRSPAAAFDRAVAPYRIESSARAYLEALALNGP